MTKFLATLLLAGCVYGAGPGGPVPGYVLDGRTATIRAVYGIPGALQLAAPVELPFAVASAGFGPAGDYALVVSRQEPAHAFLIRSLSGLPAVIDLGAVAEGTRVLAVNAAGSAALLYAGDGGAVQFVTGLIGDAVVSGPIGTAALAGAITAAALDAAGSCALVGTGALETLCADSSSRRVLAGGMDVSDLVLTPDGKDAILADRAAKQILVVRDYASASSSQVLAGADDGIDTPVGLQALSGTKILAADSGASAVFVIDADGVQRLETDVAPTQLRGLGDRSILLLNDPSAVPFTIMDLQSMHTFFIPTN